MNDIQLLKFVNIWENAHVHKDIDVNAFVKGNSAWSNATADADTINLTAAGTYKITLAGALEDLNQTGDFDILAAGGALGGFGLL